MFLAKDNKLQFIFAISGGLLFIVALLLLLIQFFPVLQLEFNYNFKQLFTDNVLAELRKPITDNISLQTLEEKYLPVNTDFSIVIPKIDAKANIVKDVDALNADAYSQALEKGIAHASVSAKPGMPGNTFLFAHSGKNFYNTLGQNVQFYLLDKLVAGDQVIIFFEGKAYIYEVFNTVKVNPDQVEYLFNQSQTQNELTLMSCWPAGINYKRQIVQLKLITP